MAATIKVLPVGRRPKCRFCAKELRPNYDTETTGRRSERRYEKRDLEYVNGTYDDTRVITRAVRADDYDAEQADDGRWYVVHEIAVKQRTFLGTYGAYKDNLFCGLRCAYRWAVRECRALDGAKVKRS